jgi:hypothetical protein
MDDKLLTMSKSLKETDRIPSFMDGREGDGLFNKAGLAGVQEVDPASFYHRINN